MTAEVIEPAQTNSNAKPYINSENARELQRKGVEVRALRKQLQEEKLRLAEESLSFTDRTLLRVRANVDKLLGELDREHDPQKLDRLASALARLNEVERQLSGRPMPGSLKPSAKSKPAIQDDIPQPIVSAPDAAQ